ncbi:hypothetical protein GMSM_26120 [Geomonas sp. Red276]
MNLPRHRPRNGQPFLLAVNYHYLGSAHRYPYPGIIGITPGEFAEQVDLLGRHLEFVGAGELEKAALGEGELPRNAAVITFDDGLKEQFAEAVPILEGKQIPFICFVNTAPLAEGRACFIHKLHYLRSVVAPGQFLSRVREVAAEKFGLVLADPDRLEVPPGYYPYDEPPARAVKFLLNFFLDTATSVGIVDQLFGEQCDEGEFCRWFYLSASEVRELQGRFQAIGMHGHSHRSLASLAEAEARREIALCSALLEEITGRAPSCISYPFGYRESVSLQVAQLAKAQGARFGFTMEMCLNRDVARHPLLLGRINNNEAPGHPRAALSFEGPQPVLLDPSRLAMSRRWFGDDSVPPVHQEV